MIQITNGLWLTPLQCAQMAVDEAGSDLRLSVKYKELVASNDNEIEYVASSDQHILRLQWQQEVEANIPGSLILNRICTEVFNQVFF
jgi:hypothetical protein